jgi:tetratricopeptide (TPR) repeat protein
MRLLGDGPIIYQTFLIRLQDVQAQDAELAEVLRLCALPREFDAEIIGVLRGTPHAERRNRELLQAVSTFNFVLALPNGGYAYHDALRTALLEKEWNQEAEREVFERRLLAYYRVKGQKLYQETDYAAARDFCSRALDLDSSAPDLYCLRGQARLRLGDVTPALVDFNRAIELFPTGGTAYYWRAMAHYYSGEYQDAVADFTAAIRRAEKDLRSYYARAVCYYRLNSYREALQDFSTALDLDKKHAESLYGRALTYSQLGDYSSAMEDAARARELNPDFPRLDEQIARFKKSPSSQLTEVAEWHLYTSLADNVTDDEGWYRFPPAESRTLRPMLDAKYRQAQRSEYQNNRSSKLIATAKLYQRYGDYETALRYLEDAERERKKAYVQVLDALGNPTGREVSQMEAHAEGLGHAICHTFVLVDDEQIYLQLRSIQKRISPGKWSSSSCGHVRASETPRQGAIRELYEELGLRPTGQLESVGQVHVTVEGQQGTRCEAFAHIFCLRTRQRLDESLLNNQEVEAVKLLPVGDVEAMVEGRREPLDFADNFPDIFRTFLSWLNKGADRDDP